MEIESEGSESNEVGLPSTSNDAHMENFVNMCDAASHVLSILREVRNSQHSSASRATAFWKYWTPSSQKIRPYTKARPW